MTNSKALAVIDRLRVWAANAEANADALYANNRVVQSFKYKGQAEAYREAIKLITEELVR